MLNDDPGMVLLWLVAVTLPLSLLGLLAPETESGTVNVLVFALLGLLQSWALWRAIRGPRVP